MSSIHVKRVTKSFGSFRAVNEISFEIEEGEFVTLLGGSGSGKTTCLRIVAGFVKPDHGHIYIGGQDVTTVPPYRRNTGMVFQNYALFPHLTVEQNVGYGLKIRKVKNSEIAARTAAALSLVQLNAYAARYPSELSGGQSQRVALARAVVIQPKVLLLDEPLSALDLKLRQELQGEIKRIQQKLQITTLFVTHDQGEALSLSDRIVVMRDGDILQVDTPGRVYRQPSSRYVADFVGRMNFFHATVLNRTANDRYQLKLTKDEGCIIEATGHQRRAFQPGERCVAGVRPEDLELRSGPHNNLRAQVLRATYVGNAWLVTCASAANGDIQAVLPPRHAVPMPGTSVVVTWPCEACVMLPDE
jgi:spermidine/putrescine ABC transporter ATP-binding subunit